MNQTIPDTLLISREEVRKWFFHSLEEMKTMIHYLKNKVGVVDFANAQGVVMF